jgi:hypothetical protein
MAPATFASHFGVAPPDTARGARLAALRFAVRDVRATANLLRNADPGIGQHMGRMIAGPAAAMGATLVFEPAR